RGEGDGQNLGGKEGHPEAAVALAVRGDRAHHRREAGDTLLQGVPAGRRSGGRPHAARAVEDEGDVEGRAEEQLERRVAGLHAGRGMEGERERTGTGGGTPDRYRVGGDVDRHPVAGQGRAARRAPRGRGVEIERDGNAAEIRRFDGVVERGAQLGRD